VTGKTYDNFYTANVVTLLAFLVIGGAIVLALFDGTAKDAGALFWVLPAFLLLTTGLYVLDHNRYTVTDTELIVNGWLYKRSALLVNVDSIEYYPSVGHVTIRANGRYFVGFSSSWFYGLMEMLHLIQEGSQCEVSPHLMARLEAWRRLKSQLESSNFSDSATEKPSLP
jgi:hypothetical protein